MVRWSPTRENAFCTKLPNEGCAGVTFRVVSAHLPLPARVLLVDDDEDILSIYAESLELNGYEVLVASNGREAVQIAFTERPAAVVMDLEMPVMNGLQATEHLKNDCRTVDVPVIVVTGATADRVRDARAAGCDALLSKPCPPDVVVLALEHVVHGKPMPRRYLKL